MRRVDKLGRIVIPQELRKKYGLTEGVKIEFFDSGVGVTVRASDSLCKICGSPVSNTEGIPLCDGCILNAATSYSRKERR